MVIAVNGTPSHSYGVSLTIWEWYHSVLPATRHKWTRPAAPALTPSRQACTHTAPFVIVAWFSCSIMCRLLVSVQKL